MTILQTQTLVSTATATATEVQTATATVTETATQLVSCLQSVSQHIVFAGMIALANVYVQCQGSYSLTMGNAMSWTYATTSPLATQTADATSLAASTMAASYGNGWVSSNAAASAAVSTSAAGYDVASSSSPAGSTMCCRPWPATAACGQGGV